MEPFSISKYTHENLMVYCRKILAIKKTVENQLQTLGKSGSVLCTVIHGSDPEAQSVVYVMNGSEKPSILRSDTLEFLPDILQSKIFGFEPVKNCSENTFIIRAFPTALLKCETTEKGLKLFCEFPNDHKPWVQVIGAIGEVNKKGQPEGVTFITRNLGKETPALRTMFVPVSQEVLASISALEKIQIFNTMQKMK